MLPILDQNILLYILLFISAIAVMLFLWVIRLEIKFRQFTLGKNGKSLEETVLHLKQDHTAMQKFRGEMEHYLGEVEKRLSSSIRRVETIRFDPFGEHSGNQSFATAFMDEHGNGLILSSIYTRNRMSVFAKPLSNFESPHELSAEEKGALEGAKAKLGKKSA